MNCTDCYWNEAGTETTCLDCINQTLRTMDDEMLLTEIEEDES